MLILENIQKGNKSVDKNTYNENNAKNENGTTLFCFFLKYLYIKHKTKTKTNKHNKRIQLSFIVSAKKESAGKKMLLLFIPSQTLELACKRYSVPVTFKKNGIKNPAHRHIEPKVAFNRGIKKSFFIKVFMFKIKK
jgi:hypothetical protein